MKPQPQLTKAQMFRYDDETIQRLQKEAKFAHAFKSGMHDKRLQFVREMIDLMYSYQDVATSSEMLLFHLYCQHETELVNEIEEKIK